MKKIWEVFPDKKTVEISDDLSEFTEKLERKHKIPFFTLALWVDVKTNKYYSVRTVFPHCSKFLKWDLLKIEKLLQHSILDFIDDEPWK